MVILLEKRNVHTPFHYQSYLCNKRHHYTADYRPEYTDNGVLVKKSSHRRHHHIF